MPDNSDRVQTPRARRGWLLLATIGCAFVCVAMIVVALVIIDKPRFNDMVGASFLPLITSGVFIGAFAVLIAALMLPERRTWRGIALIVWSLIAIASPLAGFLFLLPWALLAVTLPLVIAVLTRFYRTA
jgi:MFS family permease